MPQIASITNPNKLVEEKVNFFVDWFHYCVDNIGKHKEFELENPLSLIDKILFQFEYGRPDRRVSYLVHYFSSSFFTDDEYLSSFDEYTAVKSHIVTFHQTPKKEKTEFIANANVFVEKLLLLHAQLKKEMFAKSLNVIIDYLHCSHHAVEHKESIKFHTKILVSEYLFCNRDRNDLNSMFGKIISRELEKYPFPNEVKTKKQRLSHLSKSTLKQQFEGLLNLLYIPPKITRYIFKVYGASFEDTMSFTYNKVTFYSKDHKRFTAIREKLTQRPIGDTFFEDNHNYILASVAVSMHSEEVAVAKARKIIDAELKYVCWKLDKDLLIDTTQNYLITSVNYKNYGWHFSTNSYHKKFYADVIPHLNDTPFHHLKKVHSEVKEYILGYEHLYINAIKTRSVHDMWHYLETLLNTKKGEEKHVQAKVSAIVLSNELLMHRNQILSTLSYDLAPITINYHYFNLEFEDFRQIAIELRKRKLSSTLRNIKYPFIEELITEYDRKLTATNYREAREYYRSVLFEAFEHRNFYIHQANVNDKALIKLNYSLFNIVRRFRWALFAATKKHTTCTFSELIDYMVTEGESLLQ